MSEEKDMAEIIAGKEARMRMPEDAFADAANAVFEALGSYPGPELVTFPEALTAVRELRKSLERVVGGVREVAEVALEAGHVTGSRPMVRATIEGAAMGEMETGPMREKMLARRREVMATHPELRTVDEVAVYMGDLEREFWRWALDGHHFGGIFGGCAAHRCQVCGAWPEWRLERHGDAVVSWACHVDLWRVMESAQRGRAQEARVVVSRFPSEAEMESARAAGGAQ